MLGEEVPTMEVDEFGKTNKGAPTPKRTKKKSTLAKLKERKLKESDSSSSLPKQNSEETAYHIPEIRVKSNGSSSVCNQHISEKMKVSSFALSIDISEKYGGYSTESKPWTKSEQKAQFSETANGIPHEGREKNVNRGGNEKLGERRHSRTHSSGSISDGATLQRFKDLKMAEPALNQGTFVPKPPSTPRTPRTTPRTPRGFVGKGEKRNREPAHSGDELEVEEKKERNFSSNSNQKPNSFSHDSYDRHIVSERITNSTYSSDGAIDIMEQRSDECSSDTGKLAEHHKNGQRLLKRRNSRDMTENTTAAEQSNGSLLRDHGKPPINHNIYSSKSSSNNPNKQKYPPDRETVITDMSVACISADEIYHFKSPRDKYLKSMNKGKSSSSQHNLSSKPLSQNDSHIETTAVKYSTEEVGPSALPISLDNQSSENVHLDSQLVFESSSDNSKSTPEKPSTDPTPHMMKPQSPGRLKPLSSPRSHPPPLTEEFSSQSLRTSYKIDPNVRPSTGTARPAKTDRSDSGPPSSGDRLSQKSFNSGSVLPIITTQEARSRSYLEGSMSEGRTSLLGDDELDRYFPERKVNVLVGTWNMNELKDFAASLDDFILPERCDYVQDIYAIGTQENAISKKEWEIKIQETLGLSHVMFHSVTLGSLHLVIYIRRDLIWFCSAPEEDVISLRAMTMVKTKGAVGICFSLFGTSYLFINCHLTSDRDNDNSRKKNRLSDYNKVIQEMKFPKSAEGFLSPKKASDITSLFDCIFWFGDLNFRIERKRHAVEAKVHQIVSEEFPNFETLLGGDQLHKYMNEGKIFTGFQEGRINFHPTFKFDVNQDTYDSSSKNRVPSYTDRVMFRCKKRNDITCLHYDAVMAIKVSDHRPVYGQYCTGIRPAKDITVYCAGHFDRSVYMEANKRRAASQPVRKRKQKWTLKRT